MPEKVRVSPDSLPPLTLASAGTSTSFIPFEELSLILMPTSKSKTMEEFEPEVTLKDTVAGVGGNVGGGTVGPAVVVFTVTGGVVVG